MKPSVPPTQASVNRLPKRTSLLAETLSVLRAGIGIGRWVDCLPSERELAKQLQVSRPTVRTALRTLQKDGWVRISHGRRSRIEGRRSELPRRANRNLVALLCPDNLNQIRPGTLLRIDGLRGQFHDAGVDFHVYIRPRCFSAHPERMLQSIVKEVRAGCWLLHGTNRAVQQWFAANQTPCLIAGTTFDPLSIPCVDINQHALCRHAAGLLLSHGHSRIGFVLKKSGAAGDKDALSGFTAACREGQVGTNPPVILRHDGSLAAIRGILDGAISRGDLPSGLFIGDAMSCLAVVMALQSAGKRIPQNTALICRNSDMIFDYVTPSIARYSHSEKVMERAIFQTTMKILNGETPVRPRKLLMPEFVPGESFA